MKQFSDKRFVDIAQTLYTSWLRTVTATNHPTEEDYRNLYAKVANMSLMAAEEFEKVFVGKEKP